MWLTAGLLLGVVVVASLAGFHLGPHAHAIAAAAGVLAAAWLIVMAATGRGTPLLWLLLGADIVVSAGVGVMAWSGFSKAASIAPPARRLEGAEGIAVTDLTPEGIVRVRGEEWSAVSLNGRIAAGTRVQAISVAGVRLEVWGEEAEPLPAGNVDTEPDWRIERRESEGRRERDS
jgi:membrane-bound ClpP family serine protease